MTYITYIPDDILGLYLSYSNIVTWRRTEREGETVLIKHEDIDEERAAGQQTIHVRLWGNICVLSPALSCPAMTVKVCHDSLPPHSHDWLFILSRVKFNFPSAYNYLADHKLITFQHSQSVWLPVTNQPLTPCGGDGGHIEPIKSLPATQLD